MQNPGRFILDAAEFRNRVLSMPRNPSIIKFFRHPKLSENAGYGIDKIIKWKELTGSDVKFESDLLISSVTYPLTKVNSRQIENVGGENNGENNDEKKLIEQIKVNPKITQPRLSEILGFSLRKVNRLISALRKSGKIDRVGKTKGGYWVVNE